MAYATVADLERRWHALTPEEQSVAEVLLEDAALLIDAQASIDMNDRRKLKAAQYVSLNMVQRALATRADNSFGLSQQSIEADIYRQSFSYANPSGDLYFTGMDKRLLGISSSYMLGLAPCIHPTTVRPRHDFR